MLSHSGCACITLWTRRHRCSDSHSGFYSCCGYGHGRGAITRDCRRLFRFSLKRKGGRKKRKTPTIKHGSVTKWVYRTACVDLRQTAAVVRGVQGTYGQLVGVETNQSCNKIVLIKMPESIRVEHPVVRISLSTTMLRALPLLLFIAAVGATARPEEACVKTPEGTVVCGER